MHVCAGAFGGQRSISEVGSPPSFFFLRQSPLTDLTWSSPISPGETEGILLFPPLWTGLVTTSGILGWELNSCTSPPLSVLLPFAFSLPSEWTDTVTETAVVLTL